MPEDAAVDAVLYVSCSHNGLNGPTREEHGLGLNGAEQVTCAHLEEGKSERSGAGNDTKQLQR